MPGASDLYVRARGILLDALEALVLHRDAVVLVGAQAIYLHTGEADVAVEPYTKDADLALDPKRLSTSPDIGTVMRDRGFSPTNEPGRWVKDGIPVDLMVPEALAGPGSSGADLGKHGRKVARRARGLEGALVDRGVRKITALDVGDERVLQIAVAGPGALLVAKLHKIAERADQRNRLLDKDALDVLRLLRRIDSGRLVERLSFLVSDDLARETTTQALTALRDLFGSRSGKGALLAARALEGLEDEDTVTGSCEALVDELIGAGLEIPLS